MIMFPGSAYPMEISQQYTPATHTEAVHCEKVLLGSSILISDHPRLPDPPWGRVAKPLVTRQPTDASTPALET